MVAWMQIQDFQLERYFGKYEFTVRHQLSLSDCDTCSVGELLDLAGIAPVDLLSLKLGYTESQGDPELRAAIAEHYDHCSADDVVVTNAPQEAIFLAMQAVLKAGDRVVVQTPCYQSLLEVARSIGCEVVRWEARESDDGWEFDTDDLSGLVQGAKLLVMNAPHNPTGHHPSESTRMRVSEIAEAAGARIFSDEMYRGLERDPADAIMPEASRSERAISLWGGSKSFGLSGLRIGWLVCRDRDVIGQIMRRKDYTTICSSGPGEFLMKAGLRAAQELFGRNRELIAKNEARVRAFAASRSSEYRWRAPLAGSVGLLEVRNQPASEIAARLREEADVLVAPSGLFAMPDRHLRLGLGRSSFSVAMDQWELWEQKIGS
ncbi:pyridoxal phosphate-dependent aminotransferase [bacterium]|nr:pyridoxal phosphate-dependent aminotransferase [bacterium]